MASALRSTGVLSPSCSPRKDAAAPVPVGLSAMTRARLRVQALAQRSSRTATVSTPTVNRTVSGGAVEVEQPPVDDVEQAAGVEQNSAWAKVQQAWRDLPARKKIVLACR